MCTDSDQNMNSHLRRFWELESQDYEGGTISLRGLPSKFPCMVNIRCAVSTVERESPLPSEQLHSLHQAID